jgi:carbonic anhydrase
MFRGFVDCTVKSINFDEREYALAQFHMHATSEHALDNYHYDAEIHFVHKDTAGAGKILVTGVFLHAEEGVKENEFIQKRWGDMETGDDLKTGCVQHGKRST